MAVMPSTTFEPTSVRVMANALDEAWNTLLLTGKAGGRNPIETKLALAKRIIELASHGDCDPRTLRDSALASMAEPRGTQVRE